MIKSTMATVQENVKTSRKNATKTSNTTNVPFMNIDGIDFGSYDEFYDGNFELVDDAVIPYQAQCTERNLNRIANPFSQSFTG